LKRDFLDDIKWKLGDLESEIEDIIKEKK